MCLDTIPEEDVGNALDLASGSLSSRQGDPSADFRIELGQFGWSGRDVDWEPVPGLPAKSVAPKEASSRGLSRGDDLVLSYFASAVQAQEEAFEIYLDIQTRDVHQVKVGGSKSWVLKEKPKKRAEVQCRRLCDEDKLDFMKAMQCELGSYLEHEAVEIARRHNVPKERILGMRWVLTREAITDEKENQIGQKPKARLIIKGYQDPDLLLLKPDSPTLSTQSRNMILALAASNHWHTYLGDVKTACLNGDKTERNVRSLRNHLKK